MEDAPQNPEPLTPDQLRTRTLAYYRYYEEEPLAWGKVLFPKHFEKRTPPFHYAMLKYAQENRYLAIAAPRGSAKSTVICFLYVMHQLIFRKRRFIVIVSNTFEKSCMFLQTIKEELKNNEALIRMHGKIGVEKDTRSDAEFVMPGGWKCKMICRGADQIGAMRGVKYQAWRPDLIVGDDMEDDEMVRSPERRAEFQRLYDDALVPAGNSDTCQYIVVGTILHDDSLLAKMLSVDKYAHYRKMKFRAIYKGQILWPDKWTMEQLMEIKEHSPTTFAKEYQNDPAQGGNAIIRKDDFRYWRQEGNGYIMSNAKGETFGYGSMKDCRAAIACDLAFSEMRNADSSVIMPAFLTPTSEILVEQYTCKKGMKPEEILETLFFMEERLRMLTGSQVVIGFEKAILEQVVQHLLRAEMRRRNRFLITKELPWETDKIKRIQIALEPRYNQNTVFHKHGMGQLEYELERFPSGTHDDLCDALAGVVKLLQYAKAPPKVEKADDMFEWWRNTTIDAKKTTKPAKVTGSWGKRAAFPLPLLKSYPVFQDAPKKP